MLYSSQQDLSRQPKSLNKLITSHAIHGGPHWVLWLTDWEQVDDISTWYYTPGLSPCVPGPILNKQAVGRQRKNGRRNGGETAGTARTENENDGREGTERMTEDDGEVAERRNKRGKTGKQIDKKITNRETRIGPPSWFGN